MQSICLASHSKILEPAGPAHKELYFLLLLVITYKPEGAI